MNSFKAALIIPIILFVKSVKISPKRKFKELNFVKENKNIQEYSTFDTEISKLFNYLRDIGRSYPCNVYSF
jgi:hypothetical protein